MPNHNYESRRSTPWTGDENATGLEKFIDQCNQENFDKRHPPAKGSAEVEFLNTYVPDCCPHCHSKHFVKRGMAETGMQRYRCNGCGRTFTILTGTVFDHRKIPISEWVDFLLSIIGYGSFNLTSRNNKNSYTTTRYWLGKVFLVLRHWQDDIVLRGRIHLDETYFPVMKGDEILRPDGTRPSGLSKNKICISVACDGEHVVCIAEGFGKPSSKRTLAAMSTHMERGSILVHDGDNSHKALIELLDLSSEVHTTAETDGLDDKDNPLTPVNRQHAFLKRFLRAHSSFIRDDIQDFLNLYSFIASAPADRFEKIRILLDLALHEPILLRFRDYYGE